MLLEAIRTDKPTAQEDVAGSKGKGGVMTANSVGFLLFFFLSSTLCDAGGPVYYDQDGNPISKSQYEELQRVRSEERRAQKEKLQKAMLAKQDQYGRPLYDNNGNKIHYRSKAKPKAQPRTVKKTKPKQVYDQYGRPRYDAEGNWITYQYYVIFKKCETCYTHLDLATRAGQLCPVCKTPWQWPKEAKITEKGIGY